MHKVPYGHRNQDTGISVFFVSKKGGMDMYLLLVLLPFVWRTIAKLFELMLLLLAFGIAAATCVMWLYVKGGGLGW